MYTFSTKLPSVPLWVEFSNVLIFLFGFHDMCSKIWSYFVHYHQNGFFRRQKWTTNDSKLDLKKVHLLVLAMITSTPKTKNCGIQKITYKGMAGNMEYEDQSLLIERARTQSWPGVTQAVFANFGRGLVATRKFVKKWSGHRLPWPSFYQKDHGRSFSNRGRQTRLMPGS